VPIEARALEPKISAIFGTCVDWNLPLAYTTPLSDIPLIAAYLDSQRVCHSFRGEASSAGIGNGIVPAHLHARVMITVVRLTFPKSGKPNRVCRFFEAPVPNQLGPKTIHSSEHDFDKLPVELRTDGPLALGRIDFNAGLTGLGAAAARQEASTHKEYGNFSSERQ
jgi:hypothetical protein